MAFCGLCAPKTAQATFTAAYDGNCDVCGQHIDAGETVRWSDDGQTIAHARH